VNDSGFGRDISRWVGKETVLPSNVISGAVVGKNKQHPAVFPISLPLFFINLLSPEKGLVVDPFGGSGSTGIAALAANRNCVLIDNNESYCGVAIERIIREAGAQSSKESLEGFGELQYKQNGTIHQPRLLESDKVSNESM
jgi:site-specific DNA-methyltransferase (adenine-specific)/site-specific DNA-methyltransferase (cytosine-N4-specific)